MINREDMMELTRRMNVSRTSFTRVAGCYVDEDGEFDGSFNTNFLKLSAPERAKQLKLAKAVVFSETNEKLKQYEFSGQKQQTESMWKLLMGIRQSGLKNDAMLDVFYDVVMEHFQSNMEKKPYGIFVFHDRYDVPMKAEDKKRLWESEEVYEYLICAICPLIGEYEPGEPECGFLFPAYTDRCADLNHINVFQRKGAHAKEELEMKILGVR